MSAEQIMSNEQMRDPFLKERAQLEAEWIKLRELQEAYRRPAPQGAAEMMHLVEKYASDTADFVLVGSPVSSCEPIEQAITAVITERDALKARVAELERDSKAKTERVGPVGQPYGIVDPDYARVFTQARIVAWQYGYACVMHGSFTRDLDLLLVPWNEQARDNPKQLMKLIAQGCGLRFSDGKEDVVYSTVKFTDKPHGRKSCSLRFPQFGDCRWIDISIAPITPPAVITERDALRARVAELEKDAERYQFWRNRWGDEQFLSTLAGTIRQLSDPLIRGDYNNLDIVSDAAIAAAKEPK